MTTFNPIQTNAMPLREKLRNMAWKCVNKTLFRFTPPVLTVFRKYRVWLVRCFGAKVDWSASLHPSAVIDYPWYLRMGRKSSLGERCWVYAMADIHIGDLSCIGKDVYLLTGSHDIERSTFDLITKPITIGDGCWVATAATILPGVSIGDYSVVAAGSVVTRNVEGQSVVGGNPAKFIKRREIKE
jgi:putative colanic acid biosynthesis acetyltransferase WcaF